MREKDTVLVSKSISDRVDFSQFYPDGDSESEEAVCNVCFLDQIIEFKIHELSRDFKNHTIFISFLLPTQQIHRFFNQSRLSKILIGTKRTQDKIAYIENPRISFFKIKINHDDLYMCELIVDSNNIYS